MTEPQTSKAYPSLLQAIGITLTISVVTIVVSPLGLLLEPYTGKEFSLLATYIISMGTPFFIFRRVYLKRNGPKAITKQSYTSIYFILSILFVLILAIQVGITAPLIDLIPIPDSFKKLFLELSKMNGLFILLLSVVAAPIIEESIFRGIILDGLLKRYSPSFAVLSSSFLFGIVHLNPWQFISAFLIGVLSGWTYLRTRNLLLCIFIHFVNNLLAYIFSLVIDMESLLRLSIAEIYGGKLNLFIIIGLSIATIVLSIYYLSRIFRKSQL